MVYEKTIKSYPPPEKYSYQHLIRVWAVALLFVLVFAFTGCTDSTTAPVEIETGTVKKYYDLYEPVSQIENIECDLYYEYHSARLADSKARVITGPYVEFGTWTVDIWRTYKLEERPGGTFCIDFTTSLNSDASSGGIEWYDHTAAINYNGLQDEAFISTSATKIDRSKNTKTDVNMAWDEEDDSPYYCTWVVDGFAPSSSLGYAREWSVRLYVIFVESDATVTMYEYIFHLSLGNDEWLYDRYNSQSYTPPANR